MSRAERLRELLAESDLFYGLSEEDLDALVSIGVVRKVVRGETIFLSGQPGRQLFAVVSGQVKAVATAGDGREMVLRLLDAGEVFGELALLDGGERTATMIAAEPSEVLVLDRRDFVAVMKRKPDIAIELLAILAARLRETTELVTDTNFLEIGQRLAKKLLELSERYAEEKGDERTLRISQEELGSQIAATRVSVNMALKSWEKKGIVRTSRGRIALLDLEGLAREARAEG